LNDTQNWRLPEGVDELLPPEAWALERVRRQVLDVFRSWGFQYVEPPVIEYLDALLVGSGNDLDLQTLKVVDQRSGRLLGVRADMTSQAARIDAHSLGGAGVQRLCYAGTVVHANPLGVLESRVPEKAGAEIFGAKDLSADAEVIALLLEVLSAVGLPAPVLVLGHMGIYQGLMAPLQLPPETEQQVFAAVQGKAETDIAELLGDRPGAAQLVRLPTLMGRAQILTEARRALDRAPPGVAQALDALAALAALVQDRAPGVDLRFDLAELAGYGYHNGPVFSAYQGDRGSAIARGGRYDGIGAAFGKARPATGFDVSLKQLLPARCRLEPAIWVPWGEQTPVMSARIRALRAEGQIVVAALSPTDEPPAHCDRILIPADGHWNLRPL
jgi:ATP phosphoribosyltransferase regulatory subunit